MTNKSKENHDKNGFTLMEVLISVGIISFVVISILNAFAQRMHSDRNTSLRNIAISLAEARMEEFLKYPSSELTTHPSSNMDYIVYTGGKVPKITDTNPNTANQFRRVVQLTHNGNLTRIRVIVDYGYRVPISGTPFYPFRVTLTTQRGL